MGSEFIQFVPAWPRSCAIAYRPKDLYITGSIMVHMVHKGDNIELDVVALLIKRKDHVRNIARELNESHSTVSRKLDGLKKEGVVDAVREGKNKIFYLKHSIVARNYILQAELHKLTKLLGSHPELGIVFDEVLKETDEGLIILFGSYAKGLAKKDSDIDIYIETKNRSVKKAVEGIHTKIRVKIGEFDTSSPLIREIIKEHVIIRGLEMFHEKKQLSE